MESLPRYLFSFLSDLLSGLLCIRHPGGQDANVAVIGAATAAEDAQAEVFVYLPHLGGEALRVVAFEMVESDKFLRA
jgi:hypothetical protein